MTFKEIQDLIKLVSKSNLTEFKYKKDDVEIAIRTKKYVKEKVISAPSVMPMATGFPAPAANAAPVPAPADPVSAPQEEASASQESSTDTSNLLEIKSPIVGTFYRSASPDKPAYVKVGDTVSADSVVCIVEAMKLFNEIESEVAGKIVKVMVEDASPVEYGQVLFLVDPKG